VLAEETLYVLDRASGETIRAIDHPAKEVTFSAICAGGAFVQGDGGTGRLDLANGEGNYFTSADREGFVRGAVVVGEWVFQMTTTGHLYGFTTD